MPEPVAVRPLSSRVIEPWTVPQAAGMLGWIGGVLLAAAGVDYAAALYPPALGSMEWEFGTVSELVAGLPLGAVGLAALWMSGGLRGSKQWLMAVGVVLLLASLFTAAITVLFVTNVPAALAATMDNARLGIIKLVVKTTLSGSLFGLAFAAAGIMAVRQARGIEKIEVFS
jgi:hypothetical protein